MKKHLVSLLAILMTLAMALVACGPVSEESTAEEVKTFDVTIWVSETEGVKELTQQQVDAFNAANTDIKINATIEGVGEGDAATQMVSDVETGADIFCFAQDQLARLIQAGALQQLGTGTAAKVTAENSKGSVACGTFGDVLYAFPITDDNGYFMYYDTSVIPEEDVDSLEAIIADCEAAGKMFSFQLEGSAWYTASFFFATGCVSNWTTDADGQFTSVDDTFNSAAGLVSLTAMQKLLHSSCFLDSSSAADFSAATPSAVVVSGTWDYSNAKAALGDNFGVAELPSFTVDGKTYHLGSFNGCKMMGMKPQTDSEKASAIQRLAYYLAGEECQMARFNSFGWGPSNLNAAATETVQQDPTLNALAAQNAYAQPQGQIHGSWWDIGKLIASNAKAAEENDTARQSVLDAYSDSMNALFNMSEETKNAFTVIGAILGDSWSADVTMTKVSDTDGVQVWETETLTLNAGEEFKVRQGKSWDVNFGVDGNNFVVETTGNFVIHFEYNSGAGTGVITLIAK